MLKHYKVRGKIVGVLFLIGLIAIQIAFKKKTRTKLKSTFEKSQRLQERIVRHITEDGIYPLPQTNIRYNQWTKKSVIPKKFFRNIPNISQHNYEWIINPHRTCIPSQQHRDHFAGELEEVFLLVTIASASWEFERRNLIRKTWASVQDAFNKKIKYIFFLGRGRASNRKLQNEYDKYQDTIVESFQEAYRNLTLKTQGQLKWARFFCPNARYVMHVDDDVFADIRSIVKYLVGFSDKRLLLCGKIFMPKVRRDGKWETSVDEYRGGQYPKSCVGWCFVMTQAVVNELYITSTKTFQIHLEDVFFTGILREKIKNLNIQKLKDGERVCQHLGWPKDRKTDDKLLDAWIKLKNEEQLL